ncbi:choice-of-anchor K domain-containing protein [Planctomycetota bacterium]|nr:choice-of-anchor K domain-containing protein [Planctomycetota bacterium]
MPKLTNIIKHVTVPVAMLLMAPVTFADTFDGRSRVSSVYRPGYPENAGSTYERDNYINVYLGDSSTGDREDVDIYRSTGQNTSFNDIDLGDTFVLGSLTYTNGIGTIDGTTPEVLRNVIVARLNGSYRQFQIDVSVDNGEGGGLDSIYIGDYGAVSTDYTANFNGTLYSVELLGFGQSADDISASINSGEVGETINFNLYGQLIDYNQFLADQEAANIAVPTPAAASLGLASLMALLLRRKREQS